MKQRLYPCLCVSCPECGSVFHAVAMWQEFHGDNEGNKELLDTLCEYAEEGYNVSFRNRDEFDLKYCEHMKSSQWKDFFVNKKGSCNLHSQRRKRQFCERFKYIKHKAGILQNCLEVTSLFLLAPPFFFHIKNQQHENYLNHFDCSHCRMRGFKKVLLRRQTAVPTWKV